jgi:DNA polymerase-3 subunit epsilon
MDGCFVALDFETANYERGSACAIAMVRVEDGKIVAAEKRLINPQTYFLDGFIADHHITLEAVKDAPLFAEVWRELVPMLDGAEFIAAHFAQFDRDVLQQCCQKHKVAVPEQRFECTVSLARRAWKLYPTRLSDVCKHFGIELNHHEPLSDATACAYIVIQALQAGHKIC